ncbi:MAG: DUF4339 domain-containing protein [Opitutaceae bacterium]|nr:DUF4339 domain-containing protein [Verrucomicrobiales bacterium]
MKIHLLRDGQAFGPFSAEAIREMVKLGVVFESDQARYEGASEWITLAKLRDFNPQQSPEISSEEFEEPAESVLAEATQPAPSLALAAAGGLVVAAVGGWLWTEVAIAADREFQVIALVIASCCSAAIIYCSLGGRGTRFQLLACAATLIGILIGKSGVAWHLTRLTREAEGTAPNVGTWATVPDLLAEVFARHLPHTFNISDLLWILLALITAWKISGAEPKEA